VLLVPLCNKPLTLPPSFLSLELPKLGGRHGEVEGSSSPCISLDNVVDNLAEDWAALKFVIRVSAEEDTLHVYSWFDMPCD
jgi:hypothetical protein